MKDVANWLGFEWFDPLVDGATSIILFDKWYLRNDRAALDKAISYNSDDCKALIIVKDYLVKKISVKESTQESINDNPAKTNTPRP